MICALKAIRFDRTLPPVQVTEPSGEGRTYELYDGRHRLAASIAVGFSLVPAEIVRDLGEIKRAEGFR